MKIINKINDAIENKRNFYSFEFFPPKTDKALEKLYANVDRLGKLDPLFIDVTWGAGGSTSKRTSEICNNLQKVL
jgi:methylenetetrahydrofolate reductase (NADPH)